MYTTVLITRESTRNAMFPEHKLEPEDSYECVATRYDDETIKLTLEKSGLETFMYVNDFRGNLAEGVLITTNKFEGQPEEGQTKVTMLQIKGEAFEKLSMTKIDDNTKTVRTTLICLDEEQDIYEIDSAHNSVSIEVYGYHVKALIDSKDAWSTGHYYRYCDLST